MSAGIPHSLRVKGMKVSGLTAEALLEYGLSAMDGEGIDGELTFERPAFVHQPRRIKNSSLGAFSYVNGWGTSSLYACTVGRYCSIAESVVVGPPEHPTDWFSSHPFAFTRPGDMPRFYRVPEFARLAPDASQPTRYETPARTIVGHDVWIGAGAFVKRGLHIGDGAIVAAQSLVTRDVPPYAIVAGTPARIMRLRFPEKTVERLLKLQWWRYDLAPHKHAVDFSRVEETVATLEERLADSRLQTLHPRAYRLSRAGQGFEIEQLNDSLY